MISDCKRELIFTLAGAVMILSLAGCQHPQPAPAVVTAPPPAILPVPPPSAPAMPEPASRPRPAADAADNMATNILVWDAVVKNHQAGIGETNAPFVFNLTNISPEPVMIYDTSTTCECTIAQLPARPWTLAPGTGGQIHASLDLRNRTTGVTNYVIVFTSKGNRLLTVTAALSKP